MKKKRKKKPPNWLIPFTFGHFFFSFIHYPFIHYSFDDSQQTYSCQFNSLVKIFFFSVLFCVSYCTMNHTVSDSQMPPDITLWPTGSPDWMLPVVKMKLTILIFLEAIFQRTRSATSLLKPEMWLVASYTALSHLHPISLQILHFPPLNTIESIFFSYFKCL